MSTSTYPVLTICYLIRGEPGHEEVLMGEKAPTESAVKRGVAGRWIGSGGLLEPDIDPSPIACGIRETKKELDVLAEESHTSEMSRILVSKEGEEDIELRHLFMRRWRGTPRPDGREFLKIHWYPVSRTPENLCDVDRCVLPVLMSGRRLCGTLRLTRSGAFAGSRLQMVSSFE
ncbi:MAG: hypothetical protein HZA81_03190 [Candidatus Taylorbacteria bacterium]|nr:hypothetical protein [Candidatus Taylorbacteria bacterium]